MKKVYCVSANGSHVNCYEFEMEAINRVENMHLEGIRDALYCEDEYDPHCDCGNENISEGINHARS